MLGFVVAIIVEAFTGSGILGQLDIWKKLLGIIPPQDYNYIFDDYLSSL